MKRNLKRLALALLLSLSCFLGTVYWFESGKAEDHPNDTAPIARLSESTNDVQRKSKRRVIWESVSRNDELFPGEEIRTASDAEARIQLLKNGTVIHLEPDSLVVLEENETGLSLDFLRGNLFVQSTGEGSGDLTLKTDSGEIKVSSADMSLSRDQTGRYNLEVHKGKAELTQGSQTVALEKDKSAQISAKGVSVDKDRVQVLSPQAGETVLLNLVRGEKLETAFKPLPAGYRVTAEWGSSRGNLRPLSATSPGETGKLAVPGKSGKWFLRLVARSESSEAPVLSSVVIPVTIEPKSPPTLVEPNADGPVVRDSNERPVTFRWLNRHTFESQVLEVAADPGMRDSKLKQTMGSEATSFPATLPDGVYYWRVSGFLKIKGRVEALSSRPARFSVQSALEIKPPMMLAPHRDQRLPFADAARTGVGFRWRPALGVKRYQLLVQRKTGGEWKNVLEKDTETTLMRIAEIKAGEYRWRVSSVDPKDQSAKASEFSPFMIEDMPKIEWAEQPSEYEYPTPTPTLAARWVPVQPPPASYRFRLASKEAAALDLVWQPAKQPAFDVSVPAEGAYEVVVEALNSKGQPVAYSDPKTFQVKRRPLLPAPQWSEATPEILKTDAKGNVSFGWRQVEGAERYLMILETADGKVVQKKEVSRTTASLARLKPGQYKVKLKSVDSFQRPGQEGDPKDVVVPSTSDIRAPKIKNMKVK